MLSILTNPWFRRLTALCIIAAFVLIPSLSHAAENSFVSDVAYAAVSKGIASVLYSILAFVAWAIGWLSQSLNQILHFQLDANLVVIIDLWKIVRDFANMLFILVFIIMALGTVFDIGSLGIPGLGGGVDVKSLIAKFVIAALLINFSLVIGGIIIDAANVVNDVFLAAIGDFSTRIGSALNPSATLLGITPQELQGVGLRTSAIPSDPGMTHIVKMISSIILGMIILFSLLVAVVFCILRIPILAILLVFSPLAWIGGILPSTQKINKDWWSQFIGWNVFLPVFLFFLYFGLYFLSFQDQLLGSITTGFDPTSVTGVASSGFTITIQTLFYYFIVAFTLLGGTKFAMDAASGGGKLLTDTVARSREAVSSLPVFSQFRAARQAAKTEIDQINKEGLGSRRIFGRQWGVLDNIYGGEPGRERMVQRERAQLFGDRATGLQTQSAAAGGIDKRLKELKALETGGKLQINKEFENGTYTLDPLSSEGLARRAILYERGMINATEFGKDIDIWTQRNPFLAEAMLEKAGKGKYRNVKGDQLLAMASGEGAFSGFKDRPTATTTRRILFNAIKENDDALKAMSVPQLQEAISLMGGDSSNESKEFIKAVANKRPDLVGQYKASISKGENKSWIALRETYKTIKDKKPGDLAEALDKAWDSELLQNAVKIKASILNKRQPLVRPGIFIPDDVQPPSEVLTTNAWPPVKKDTQGNNVVDGIDAPGGRIYNVTYFQKKLLKQYMQEEPRAMRTKPQAAGGEKFLESLRNAEDIKKSPSKLRRVGPLKLRTPASRKKAGNP